jgi:hypothetical protein
VRLHPASVPGFFLPPQSDGTRRAKQKAKAPFIVLIFLLFRQPFSDLLWYVNAFVGDDLYFSCSLQGLKEDCFGPADLAMARALTN